MHFVLILVRMVLLENVLVFGSLLLLVLVESLDEVFRLVHLSLTDSVLDLLETQVFLRVSHTRTGRKH